MSCPNQTFSRQNYSDDLALTVTGGAYAGVTMELACSQIDRVWSISLQFHHNSSVAAICVHKQIAEIRRHNEWFRYYFWATDEIARLNSPLIHRPYVNPILQPMRCVTFPSFVVFIPNYDHTHLFTHNIINADRELNEALYERGGTDYDIVVRR